MLPAQGHSQPLPVVEGRINGLEEGRSSCGIRHEQVAYFAAPAFYLCHGQMERRQGVGQFGLYGRGAFGGKGLGDTQPVKSQYNESQGKEQSITLKLPAMSAAIYRCTRKFPARRKKAEGTKTTKKAAKPAAKAKASAPAVKEKAPAPAVKKKASAPAAKEKAPAPAVKEKASAPAVKEKAPAPVVKEKAPAPAVKEKASAPAVKEKTPAPQKKAEKKNATEKKGK